MDRFSPDRLLQAMREKGLTQAELAKATGVSPSLISRVLRELRSPGSKFIASLKAVFPEKPLEFFFDLGCGRANAEPDGGREAHSKTHRETGEPCGMQILAEGAADSVSDHSSNPLDRKGTVDLAQEIRSLYFRNTHHAEVLLMLLEKADLQDTTHDLFVPLYALAAIGPEVLRFVSPRAIDFCGLIEASGSWTCQQAALVSLAGALSSKVKLTDLFEAFSCLSETEFFEVAVSAVKMRWEF